MNDLKEIINLLGSQRGCRLIHDDNLCLKSNCLYNFREAMRRRHASDFAEAVADMRRKLARMYEVKAQLPPATRKRLRRVVKHYGWYYLTHFVFRKKR